MPDNSIYAHTTNVDSLRKMLDSGSIKSLRHIAKDTPNSEISVEPFPIPIRKRMAAKAAYELMRGIKDVDKAFLTKGGYLPNYGDVVITKSLGSSVRPHESWNTIPDEYTTRRKLSLRNNANIYVPDESLDALKAEYGDYNLLPKSELELAPYSFGDRAKAFGGKFVKRLGSTANQITGALGITKTGSDYRRLFGSNAQLVGSEALGINLPNSSDTDVFVPYKRKANFDKALARMNARYPGLKMNAASMKRDDKKTFTGNVNGKDMDVVIAYGPRAERFRQAFGNAKAMLTPEEQRRIVAEKQRLKNAWLFPETRYKRYKNRVADELGLKAAYF